MILDSIRGFFGFKKKGEEKGRREKRERNLGECAGIHNFRLYTSKGGILRGVQKCREGEGNR